MNPERITIQRELCCGCGACEAVCPRRAIEMKPDFQGFLYPNTNTNCVRCGRCANVCPVNAIRTHHES